MRRVDLAEQRRELELLRIENMQLKREMNMLNAPVMNEPRYQPTPTPRVFPDRPKRKPPVRTIYVTDGATFWRGFVLGALLVCLAWVVVITASLV